MIEFGCLCYKNEVRKERMKARFEALHLPYRIFDTFDYSQNYECANYKRILDSVGDDLHLRRVYSCILNHLFMLQHYYERTTQEYIVVCEDDVMLRWTISHDLPYIIDLMKKQDLDIVLLGCLLPYLPQEPGLHGYAEDLWGTQSYLVNRRYAGELLKRFIYDSSFQPTSLTFAADWVITKLSPKRAFVYPMLCVEEGESGDKNDVHGKFHQRIRDLHCTADYI